MQLSRGSNPSRPHSAPCKLPHAHTDIVRVGAASGGPHSGGGRREGQTEAGWREDGSQGVGGCGKTPFRLPCGIQPAALANFCDLAEGPGALVRGPARTCPPCHLPPQAVSS